MTNEQAVAILFKLASDGKDAYHPSYEWTVEYAKRCKAHFGGVDVDEYMKQFARRESDELFEQRKKVTSHVNKSLGAALDRPFSKVPRSNFTKTISFDGDDKGDISKRFETDVLSRFTRRGLDGYVFERVRYWSKFDPNTFIVTEFDSTDGTKRARPYPFEVTSEMAVDFAYSVHGDLEYLVSRQSEKIGNTPVGAEIQRLTIYRPLQTVVLQQLSKKQIEALTIAPTESKEPPETVANEQLIRIGSDVYQVQIPLPHNYQATPAIRVGFQENPEDDGFSRVGIFDAALPFAQKIVKINSELDIVTAFLAFPVSVRYEDPCDATGCLNGKLQDNSTCMACKGSGFKPRPTSAQEELVLPMPRNPEDMFDLTKILHYTYPPTDSVEMQIKLMQHYFMQAKESVFNSEMFSKQETAQTATFHGIALQSVYDTLKPYADNVARIWGFLADVCRVFTGFRGAMSARLVFPHDFRFETASDLFDELKQARDSEAGNDTAGILEERIMGRLLIDDRERLTRWQVDNAYNPFRTMTEAQILTALNSPIVPEWKKVFWLNRQDIMAEILLEHPEFYKLESRAQRSLIMAAVEKLKSELDAARPALNLGALDNEPQPQATD